MTANKTIDEILTKAFNDFYDYIIEKDIVKVAHEYSEKTVYKEAHQAITQAMLDALPKYRDNTDSPEPHPVYDDHISVGFNQAIDQIESAIKLIGGSDENI